VIYPGSKYHAENVVVVSFGVFEPLQDDKNHTIGPTASIGIAIPGFACM